MPSPLEKYNSKTFAEQLHTQFDVQAGGAPMALRLVEVQEHETSPKLELFALHFLGPFTPRLAQQIHRMEHEKLGVFDLFLTAIGADEKGTMYEAVFHRFRKETS